MPWGDKSVSPCVYTPGAGEMTLGEYLSERTGDSPVSTTPLSISSSKIVFDAFGVPIQKLNLPDIPALSPNQTGAQCLFKTQAGSYLYVSIGGTKRSTDGMNTWSAVSSGPLAGPLFQLPSGRIWGTNSYSDNDGSTWTYSNRTGGWGHAVGYNAFTGTLLHSSVYGRDLFRSTDGGDSFTTLTGALAASIGSVRVYQLWAIPGTNRWLCSGQGKIQLSTDDGVTFSALVNAPSGDVRYIKASDGNIYAIASDGVWKSTDSGANFTRVSTISISFGYPVCQIGSKIVIARTTASGVPCYFWVWYYDIVTGVVTYHGGVTGSILAEAVYTINRTWMPLFVDGKIIYPWPLNDYAVALLAQTITTSFPATLLSANAFQPTAPAKLASLPSAVLALDTTGAAGTVALYLQHYNDEVARWESYAGVADAWTEIGTYSATATIDLPTLPARAGEKVIAKLVFTSTDVTAPAPSFVSLALSWTSDVTAPDAPTKPTLQVVSATSVTINVNSLPADARHMLVEVDSGSGYVPISSRGFVENGQNYLRFRPGNIAIQSQSEFNNPTFLLTGYSAGTIVTIRSKTVDNVGNESDWVVSDPVTTATLLPVVTPQLWIDDLTLLSNSGNIRVHLNGPTIGEVSVSLNSANGTAISGVDYTTISTTLTFNASTSPHQYVDVPISVVIPDYESKQFTLVLSSPSGATIGRSTGTISLVAEEPVLVTPKLTIDDIVLQAGDTSVLKIHRNGITDKVITVDYEFVADTATTPEDFTPASGTLIFGIDIANPHAYQEIAINATGTDPKADSVKYKVVLSNPTNATVEKSEGIVEIQNFDVIPYPVEPWKTTWKRNRWSATWKP